jgi:hypothetical protein
MLLIDDLLALPFRGLWGVLEKIAELADRELNDADSLREKLLEIQLLYEMDEIDEAEYTLKAAALEARLNAVREAEDEGDPEPVGSET